MRCIKHARAIWARAVTPVVVDDNTPRSRPLSVPTIRGGSSQSLKRNSGRTKRPTMSLGPALASPSTLNTPLHTLSGTAFAMASAVDNIVLKVPGPRTV